MENLSKDISFRWLGPEEFGRIREVCVIQDWAVPDPSLASILVGEAGGEIVMFCIVQRVAYVGPAWIDDSFRHQGYWREPMDQVVEAVREVGFPGFMFLATSEATEHIAKELGASRVDGIMYVRDLRKRE